MRKSGSRAKVQFVKAEVWHGLGYGKTARDCRTRHCHVNFGAEPPQGSCCPFVSFLLAHRSGYKIRSPE